MPGASVTDPEAQRPACTVLLYYLSNGPAHGFVREELLVVPRGTELPPDSVLMR